MPVGYEASEGSPAPIEGAGEDAGWIRVACLGSARAWNGRRRWILSVDGQEVGRLRARTYFDVCAPPGDRSMRLKWWLYASRN